MITTRFTTTTRCQVCGVVEVAECETKVEVVPGLQCRPAMERVCTQIQQVRIFRPNKKIFVIKRKNICRLSAPR